MFRNEVNMIKLLRVFSFSIIILVFLSCGNPISLPDEITAYITGVRLTPLDKRQEGIMTHYFHSDTLRGQVVFEVKTLYRMEGGTLEDFYNSQGSTEDRLVPRVTNPLVWGKAWLRSNKDIESDGVTVKARDNILQYENLNGRYYFPYALSPFAIHNIRLDTDRFQIQKGKYKIYAGWENVEGKVFSDEIEVYIDIGD
jgi:hypothetical protein